MIRYLILRALILGGLLWLVLSLAPGCAGKVPVAKEDPAFPMDVWFGAKVDETSYVIEVILVGDTAPTAEDIKQHILRVNQLCTESGEGRASKIMIQFKADIQHTGIGYICELQDPDRQPQK